MDIVSFFITGRLIGQADSDAFLNAMIEQLGSLHPASERFPSVLGARAGAWWDLLASASADAEERGRRLVVIVGGLDEDEAGAPPHKLDPVLRGVFGRSLYTRASADPRDPQTNPATRVFLFAHETLRVTAEEQLGSGLARYRERVHAWIVFYSASGWPDTTPGYAIRGYPRLLTGTADVTRLSALARDPRRHAFLLEVTDSDYTALSEIATAQSLLSGQEAMDLKALVELAAYRLAIFLRNESIPEDLPVVWALLGRFDHAEAIARTIADPDERADALTSLVTATRPSR